MSAAEASGRGYLEAPEVVFPHDPIFKLPQEKLAEFGASLLLYVMSEVGVSLEIDYGRCTLWMGTDEKLVELLPVPAPLLVDFARCLLDSVDARALDEEPQKLLKLPDDRELTIAWGPREPVTSPTRRLIIAGFKKRVGRAMST